MIGTSWKMHLLPSTTGAWIAVVRRGTEDLADRDLFVLPPFPALAAARQALEGSAIRLGAQDVHPEDEGAHTGDVSAPMLLDVGCEMVEVGHSERRRDHCETNRLVGRKVRAALRWGLMPLLCVGERLPGPIRSATAVVLRQLHGALGDLGPRELGRVVVAYEPVWAIGEGARAADPGHVAALHGAIRRWLDERGGSATRVLYGGSVDLGNAPRLLAVPGVDGLFVGRAALDPSVFVAIARLPIPSQEGRR
jgi:triosephosphate isomerase